jgi:hypothetical protein
MSVGGTGNVGGPDWETPEAGPPAEGAPGAEGAPEPAAAPVRRDLPDPRARHLLFRMETETSHDPILPEWLRILDTASNVRKFARTILADGKVTAEEALALVNEAEDYFDIRPGELKALRRLLDEHGEKFDPAARMALDDFLKRKRPGT